MSNHLGATAGKAKCSRAALASPSIMWPVPALRGSSRITQNNLAWPIRAGEALVKIRDPPGTEIKPQIESALHRTMDTAQGIVKAVGLWLK